MALFGACRPARADRFADDRRAVLTPPRLPAKWTSFVEAVGARSAKAGAPWPPAEGAPIATRFDGLCAPSIALVARPVTSRGP